MLHIPENVSYTIECTCMPINVSVGVVDEKYERLRSRKDKAQALGARIERIVRQVEYAEAPRWCGMRICSIFPRWRKHGAIPTSTVDSEAMSAKVGSADNVGFSRAVFGLAGGKKGQPAAKLEEAASVMRERILQLEERAQRERSNALALKEAGHVQQAIRALKKAKASETQLEANQSSLMAVEQQVDMLAQAAMQKTLTSALASTSKSMKADGKMLSKAERAIDDATEARDMATDLNGVMAEFAQNGTDALDDDLLAELDSMAMSIVAPQQTSNDENAKEIARLEAMLAERQTRVMVVKDSFPTAPVGEVAPTPATANGKAKSERGEKAGLLAV